MLSSVRGAASRLPGPRSRARWLRASPSPYRAQGASCGCVGTSCATCASRSVASVGPGASRWLGRRAQGSSPDRGPEALVALARLGAVGPRRRRAAAPAQSQTHHQPTLIQ